jgi:hypothetical protein
MALLLDGTAGETVNIAIVVTYVEKGRSFD